MLVDLLEPQDLGQDEFSSFIIIDTHSCYLIAGDRMTLE